MHGKLDLVHQRFALAGVRNGAVAAAVAGLVAPMKRGAWIQLDELDLRAELYADCGQALRDQLAAMREVFEAGGAGGDFAPRMAGWLREAGLVDVEEMVECSIGKRCGDEEAARRSTEALTASTEMIQMGAVGEFGFLVPS